MALLVQKWDERQWKLEMKKLERERKEALEIEQELAESAAKAAQKAVISAAMVAAASGKPEDLAALKEAKLARDKDIQEAVLANMAAKLKPIQIKIADTAADLDAKIEERNKQMAEAARERVEYVNRQFANLLSGAESATPSSNTTASPVADEDTTNSNKASSATANRTDIRAYKATIKEIKNEMRETRLNFRETYFDDDDELVINIDKLGSVTKSPT